MNHGWRRTDREGFSALARDHDGALWVGTSRNLVRQEAGDFEVVALPNEEHPDVRDIEILADGRIIVLQRGQPPIFVIERSGMIAAYGRPDGLLAWGAKDVTPDPKEPSTAWVRTDGFGLVRFVLGPAAP